MVAAFSGMGRDDQRATAGRLMSGSSLIWLMVSSVMYLARWTAHSSFCSSRIAPTRRTMASEGIKAIISKTLREQWLTLEAPPLAPVVAEIRARCEEAGLALPSYVTIARRIPALFSPEEIARKRSANPKHLLRLKPRPGYIHAPHPLDVCQIDHTPTDLSENKVARPG
ncbi:hypothetical protein N185_30230 [Sinorhizobium sp. GW3]|nr:hypothetical protein ASD49_21300 [Ensifer sp. Root1298]KRD64552.1 hypothetical protein ASE71_30850 [Ensifer sp. Root954]KSV67364.1 hypothetical protein N185_30230 [Sinorhizobium sp. GW3]